MYVYWIMLGTGEFTIRNDECPEYVMDISYFFALKERLQIIYPLQFTKVMFFFFFFLMI